MLFLISVPCDRKKKKQTKKAGGKKQWSNGQRNGAEVGNKALLPYMLTLSCLPSIGHACPVTAMSLVFDSVLTSSSARLKYGYRIFLMFLG